MAKGDNVDKRLDTTNATQGNKDQIFRTSKLYIWNDQTWTNLQTSYAQISKQVISKIMINGTPS